MDVLRQVFSVLLVFSLLGAVLWLPRRGGRISFQVLAAKRALGDARTMIPVERLSLTPQHTLHIVRDRRTGSTGGDASARLLRFTDR